MGKARSSKGLLFPPAARQNYTDAERESWLNQAVAGFRAQGQANREYYAVILRELWPEGHGLPGPAKTEVEIRNGVNAYRKLHDKTEYRDVFRRLRELQGDEGFTCIIKEGTRYQLIGREVSPKREPRSKPSKALWEQILEANDHSCANCGAVAPPAKLSWDHRVPRSRGGNNDDSNWQPLCEQCNIMKSAACQGCTFNCQTCPWAFPKEYKPVVISDRNRELLRRDSEKRRLSASEIANDIILSHFERTKGK